MRVTCVASFYFSITCNVYPLLGYFAFQGFREGGTKFVDYRYDRRAFRPPPPPPPYTQSTSVHSEFDKRSDRSERIYSTAYEGRKLPLRVVDYDRVHDERTRSSGFYPPLDRGYRFYPPVDMGLKDDRPSISLKENTVYIPYAPRFSNSFLSEKIYSENFYPRLSIKEIDDNESIVDEIKYKRMDTKPGLPQYELEYL